MASGGAHAAHATHSYVLRVETGPYANGGTDFNVRAALHGDQATSAELLLNALPSSLVYYPPSLAADGAPLFAPSTVREFAVDLPFLGNITAVSLRLDPPPRSFEAAWRLEKVSVSDETLHRGWRFVAARWLNGDAGHAVTLVPTNNVAAGRRATTLSARRRSAPRHVGEDAAPPHGGAAAASPPDPARRFQTNLSIFRTNDDGDSPKRRGGDAPGGSADSAGSAPGGGAGLLPGHFVRSASTTPDASVNAELGVRSVAFSVKRFARKGFHMYLTGDSDLMGKWEPEKGLRMVPHIGGDGTFRGEWRLRVEMDDTSGVLEYAYVLVNTAVGRCWWEGCGGSSTKRSTRTLKLSGDQGNAPDRSVGGGVLFVNDQFDNDTCLVNDNDVVVLADEATAARAEGKPTVVAPLGPSDSALFGPRGRAAGSRGYGMPPVHEDDDDDDESDDDESDQDDEDDDVTHMQMPAVVSFRKMFDDDAAGSTTGEDVAGSPAPGRGARARARDRDRALNGVDDFGADGHISSPPSEEASPPTSPGSVGLTLPDLRRRLKVSRELLATREGAYLSMKARNQVLEDELATLRKASAEAAASAPPAGHSPVSSDGEAQAAAAAAHAAAVAQATAAAQEAGAKADAAEEAHAATKRELEGALARAEKAAGEVERLSARLEGADKLGEKLLAETAQVKVELDDVKRAFEVQVEEVESRAAELVRLEMDIRERRREEMDALLKDRDQAVSRWSVEFAQRRSLFNLVQELRGNIRVFCRVRPPKAGGKIDHAKLPVSFPDLSLGGADMSTAIEVGQKRFDFDHVFPPESTQDQVYAETAGVVCSVLDGYNVCVFAYGQTGSGKTFTMNGSTEHPGVNFRALTDLFKVSRQRGNHSTFEISVSMMEIYNENLQDLIANDAGKRNAVKLEIRKDPNASSPNGVYVPGLTSIPVASVEDVWKVMETGATNRAQHATDMNEHSSRSHLVLAVNVVCMNRVSKVTTTGTLSLVDLAGSERLSRSKAAGERLKEAQHINKSLATLGDVFMALVEKSSYIPYRNSKLTYLLQESLGGDSKTLMFVNMSCDKADVGESLSSLQFAQRVARVERGAASVHSSASGTANPRATTTSTSAAAAEKDAQVTSLQAKLVSAEREVRKRADEIDDLRRRAAQAEADAKASGKQVDEMKRKDGSDRMAANASLATAMREAKDLRTAEEKLRNELRSAKTKARDVALSKDDEIKKLKASLEEKEARIRRFELERKSSPSGGTKSSTSRSSYAPGVGAGTRGNVGRPRLPARSAHGSRSFSSGQTRQVRFESPSSLAKDVASSRDASSNSQTQVSGMLPPVFSPPKDRAKKIVDSDRALPEASSNGTSVASDGNMNGSAEVPSGVAVPDAHVNGTDASADGDSVCETPGQSDFGSETGVEGGYDADGLSDSVSTASGVSAVPSHVPDSEVVPAAPPQTDSDPVPTSQNGSATDDSTARQSKLPGTPSLSARRSTIPRAATFGAGRLAASPQGTATSGLPSRRRVPVTPAARGESSDDSSATPGLTASSRLPRSTPNLRPPQRGIPSSLPRSSGLTASALPGGRPKRSTGVGPPRRAGSYAAIPKPAPKQ